MQVYSHLLALLAIHLPQLSALATRLGLAPALPTPWLPPELGSALELGLGLVLPLVVYTTLPAYSKFRQAPDDSDVKNEIHRQGKDEGNIGDHDSCFRSSRTPSRRMSFSSQAV